MNNINFNAQEYFNSDDSSSQQTTSNNQLSQYKIINKQVCACEWSTWDEYIFKNLKLKVTKGNQLLISDLIEQLKENGVPISQAKVYLKNKSLQRMDYVSQDPLPKYLFIDFSQFDAEDQLMVKFHYLNFTAEISLKNDPFCEKKMFAIKQQEVQEQTKKEKQQIVLNKLKSKRVKDRYISYVIQQVSEWRKIYESGLQGQSGKSRFTLQKSADQIGLSKKTLDDYYGQINKAEEYGFDFDNNQSSKMSVLRKFVRDQEQKAKVNIPAPEKVFIIDKEIRKTSNLQDISSFDPYKQVETGDLESSGVNDFTTESYTHTLSKQNTQAQTIESINENNQPFEGLTFEEFDFEQQIGNEQTNEPEKQQEELFFFVENEDNNNNLNEIFSQ